MGVILFKLSHTASKTFAGPKYVQTAFEKGVLDIDWQIFFMADALYLESIRNTNSRDFVRNSHKTPWMD